MAENQGTHLYGEPDDKDVPPPANEGLRGERSPAGDRPDLRHKTLLGDGRSVEIEEESGIAAAENAGAGRDPDAGNAAGDPAGKRQV